MSDPEATDSFTDAEWAVRMGVLQEALGSIVYSWFHEVAERTFACELIADSDPLEPIGLAVEGEDIYQVLDPAGFAPDGSVINPGKWLIDAIELYTGISTSNLPDRFRYFRTRVRAKSVKKFVIDEGKQTIKTYYSIDGKYAEQTPWDDPLTLPDLLESLQQAAKQRTDG